MTTNELYILEKLSVTSFVRNIENNPVLLSVNNGATVVSYHWSTLGFNEASPRYCITTNGLGLIVFVANALLA